MENPLLLFPQLNISASKDKPYYKVTKSAIKEEPHKASKPGVSPEEAVKWGESFDKLLSEKAGLDAFTKFLKTEFSEENIEFWIACEDYKKSKNAHELLPKAKTIFETFIQKDAPKEVNLDFHTKEVTSQSMGQPLRSTFDAAQSTVYRLMEQDSYPRFLRSAPYLGLLQARPAARAPLRRRSRSFTVSDFKGVRPDLTVW
ncbi:regulator of G-protein signaling 18 isoform X4 [Passer domesticus]|uniref:regulator of G-protein signaling 18 isoform X4 n=1 Tax=Passer domesticus TaxID=48849 RepID=UPI0030FF1C76